MFKVILLSGLMFLVVACSGEFQSSDDELVQATDYELAEKLIITQPEDTVAAEDEVVLLSLNVMSNKFYEINWQSANSSVGPYTNTNITTPELEVVVEAQAQYFRAQITLLLSDKRSRIFYSEVAEVKAAEAVDEPDPIVVVSEPDPVVQPTPVPVPSPEPVLPIEATYGYTNNVMDSMPLAGATLERKPVYFFVKNTQNYNSILYYCCKGLDGAALGEPHGARVDRNTAPYTYMKDMSLLAGGKREIYFDAVKIDGSGYDANSYTFTLKNAEAIIPKPLPVPIDPPVFSGDGILFGDSFESGNLNHSDNGVSWWYGMPSLNQGPNPNDRKPYVSTENPRSGKYSLKFTFGESTDKSSTSEQRFKTSSLPSELWIKFHLFIPANYKHRGPRAAGYNNKFMYIDSDNQYVGFEAWPTTNGGSGSNYIPMHLKIDGRDLGHDHGGQRAPFVQTNTDLNKWHEWIIHLKLSTTPTSNDGEVEMWKNGVQVMENLNLPNHTPNYNFFEDGYLLGWANSGFAERTILYMDDVVFSTKQILSVSK